MHFLSEQHSQNLIAPLVKTVVDCTTNNLVKQKASKAGEKISFERGPRKSTLAENAGDSVIIWTQPMTVELIKTLDETKNN